MSKHNDLSLTFRNSNNTTDKGTLKLHSSKKQSDPSSVKRNVSTRKIYRMGYKSKNHTNKDFKNEGSSDTIQEDVIADQDLEDSTYTEQKDLSDLMEVPEEPMEEVINNEDPYNTVQKVLRPKSAVGNKASTMSNKSKPWV
jgi:hypothetical protein